MDFKTKIILLKYLEELTLSTIDKINVSNEVKEILRDLSKRKLELINSIVNEKVNAEVKTYKSRKKSSEEVEDIERQDITKTEETEKATLLDVFDELLEEEKRREKSKSEQRHMETIKKIKLDYPRNVTRNGQLFIKGDIVERIMNYMDEYDVYPIVKGEIIRKNPFRIIKDNKKIRLACYVGKNYANMTIKEIALIKK